MATSGSRDIAIVGVAESDVMGTTPNKSSLQHHGEAAYNALEDAGLSKNDVDGLLTAGFSTLATAEYLGIHPGFTDNTSVGGLLSSSTWPTPWPPFGPVTVRLR